MSCYVCSMTYSFLILDKTLHDLFQMKTLVLLVSAIFTAFVVHIDDVSGCGYCGPGPSEFWSGSWFVYRLTAHLQTSFYVFSNLI